MHQGHTAHGAQIAAAYRDRDEMRADYPELTEPVVKQALRYAAATLGDEVVTLRTAS